MEYRIKIGNVYEIPLPDGTNAYGRLYKEYTLAIYSTRAYSYNELPNTEEYQCFIGVYKDLLTDGKWKVVVKPSRVENHSAFALFNFNRNIKGFPLND